MGKRLLVIDSDEDFRLLVSQVLAIEWPDAEVEDYAPTERALSSKHFKLAEFDALIAGVACAVGNPPELLDPILSRTDRPILVLCGDAPIAEGAKLAQGRGSAAYLPRSKLNRTLLIDALQRASAPPPARNRRHVDRDGQDSPTSGDHAPDSASVVDLGIRGYRTLKELGEGGMSRVFLARRESDGQNLVLKVLDHQLSKDNEQLQRFMHEYQIVSNISSPHVVKIFDQGFTDDHVFIAMEYFAGGDLHRLLHEAFAPKRALRLLVEIATALDAIHQMGIVHRDLKPHNVMFRRDRSLALVDFGISKLASQNSFITLDGDILGTPYYMSPEQAQGKVVDQRSDLYSLGVMFYEMLTGEKPYGGTSVSMILQHHTSAPIPILPAPVTLLQRLVNSLLAKDPAERFQSAADIIRYVQDRWGATTRSGLRQSQAA